MFQLFLRARAHNYFKTRLGDQEFKARSADRDVETDRSRVSSILEAVETALHSAEQEQSGLSRRVEDVLARAAVTMGNGTDDLFGAEEALKGGLVRSIHPPEELLPAAQALAKKFAASSSSSVAAAVNRRLMWSMWGAQDPLDAVTLDLQCVGYLAAGADAQEGIKSFFEKRAPNFPLKPSKDMPPFGPWAK